MPRFPSPSPPTATTTATATNACCSPFTEERTPSFFVRVVKGQWLFKDFSSGAAGRIFDFVRMKERLGTFSEAVRFVRERVGGRVSQMVHGNYDTASAPESDRSYDAEELYRQFRPIYLALEQLCRVGKTCRPKLPREIKNP